MSTRRRADRTIEHDRVRDDAGGVWIVTGWVVGLIVYAGVVLAWHAGFGAAAPFVVIPAVLVVMVGAGNLISGRRPGRPAPRFNRPDPVPVDVLREQSAPGRRGRAPDSERGTGPRRRGRHPDRGVRRRPMTQFRDRGVVLRTIRLGEADRIVTLMTEHHGKVRAVAKGVRRTTSKFGSRLEPLSHVALLGWQGRGDLDTINQVEVIDTFRPVREDLDRMSAGLSMLEVVDQVGQERLANPRLYEMVVRAIAALAERNSPMVAPAFFLKVLALEGSAPMLDGCVSCGEDDDAQLVAFDIVEGGVLCRACRRGRPLSPDGLVLLRRTLGGGLSGVLAETRSPVTDEVTALATEAMEAHLDRRLRSVRTGQVS